MKIKIKMVRFTHEYRTNDRAFLAGINKLSENVIILSKLSIDNEGDFEKRGRISNFKQEKIILKCN